MTVEHGVADKLLQNATIAQLRIDGHCAEGDRELTMAGSPRPRISWELGGPERALGGRVLIEGHGYRWQYDLAVDQTFCDIDDDLPPHALLQCTLERRYADHAEVHSLPFGTAGFDDTDWLADWCPVPNGTSASVTLPDEPAEHVRVTIAARGVVRILVDGVPISPDRIDTSRTDAGRALHRSFDVSDLARPGAQITVIAGTGGGTLPEHDPEILAEVLMLSGTGIRRIAWDDNATRLTTQVVTSIPFYLEAHDSAASGRTLAAQPRAATRPRGALHADTMPPIRAVQTVACAPITTTASGARIYDVGTNIAGRARIRLLSGIADGTVVEAQHGELLGADGHVDTTNITMPFDAGRPRQVLRHTIRRGDVVIEPWFAYYGFRYVELRGLPADAQVAVDALVMHTDLASTLQVQTESDEISLLLERGRRTLLNNVHGIPEDCPTREQSGWTGDVASSAEWLLGAFDSASFVSKWLDDLATSQQPDGAIPAVSPDVRGERMPSDPVWASALPRLLIGHWMHYGDGGVVDRMLPTLHRWAEFLLSCRDEQGLIAHAPTSYGHDWLAAVQTPPPLLHTAAAIECFTTLAELCRLTGDHDAARRWHGEAAAQRNSARKAFWHEAGRRMRHGTQGAIALGVSSGIVPEHHVAEMLDQLVADIRMRGNRPSGGFATIRPIVRVLQNHGRSDVILDMLRQRVQPGIGAMLHDGPGTFWETWSINPANTGTGSLDHVGLGGPFAAWVHTGLFGVQPVSPGYRRFDVAPALLPGLGPLRLRMHTVAGWIEVDVEQQESGFRVRLLVPAGCTATLRLPGEPSQDLGAGEHERFAAALDGRAGAMPADAEMDGWTSGAVTGMAVFGGLVQRGDARVGDAAEPGEGVFHVREVGSIDCTPIPHEQLEDGVQLVTGEGSVRTEVGYFYSVPLDLGDADEVHAFLDVCWLDTDAEQEMTMRVTTVDGEGRSATARLWPSGWNRIAVPLVGWAGRGSIRSIHVGLRATGRGADNAITAAHVEASSAVRFHIGGVWSRASA